MFSSSALIKWCKSAIEEFAFQPVTVNVTLLNEESVPLDSTFSFINAWPVKWSVTDFKAQDSSLAIETLELSYNYFVRIKL